MTLIVTEQEKDESKKGLVGQVFAFPCLIQEVSLEMKEVTDKRTLK